jgi:hypothetical protein
LRLAGEKLPGGDQRKEDLIREISAELRQEPLAYVVGFHQKLGELWHARWAATETGEDVVVDEPAGFVRQLRAQLPETIAKIAATDESDPDSTDATDDAAEPVAERDGTIDAIVFVGQEHGQPQDTLTLRVPPNRYQDLRNEIRGLVSHFAAEHKSDPNSTDDAAEPGRVANSVEKTVPRAAGHGKRRARADAGERVAGVGV